MLPKSKERKRSKSTKGSLGALQKLKSSSSHLLNDTRKKFKKVVAIQKAIRGFLARRRVERWLEADSSGGDSLQTVQDFSPEREQEQERVRDSEDEGLGESGLLQLI